MTSLSPKFFSDMGEKEKEIAELKGHFPFLENSYNCLLGVMRPDLEARNKRALQGGILLKNDLINLEMNFYISFHRVICDDVKQFDFYDEINIPGLKEEIKKDLQDVCPEKLKDFIFELNFMLNINNEEFRKDFLVKMIKQSKTQTIFSLPALITTAKQFDKYLPYLVTLLSENCSTEEIYYFFSKTAYSKCSGHYAEIYKRFIHLVNADFTMKTDVVVDTTPASEEEDELLKEFGSLIKEIPVKSYHEVAELLNDGNLEIPETPTEISENSLVHKYIEEILANSK